MARKGKVKLQWPLRTTRRRGQAPTPLQGGWADHEINKRLSAHRQRALAILANQRALDAQYPRTRALYEQR